MARLKTYQIAVIPAPVRRAGAAGQAPGALRRRGRGRSRAGHRRGLRHLSHGGREASPVHRGERGGYKPHRRRALPDGKRGRAGAENLARDGLPGPRGGDFDPRPARAVLHVTRKASRSLLLGRGSGFGHAHRRAHRPRCAANQHTRSREYGASGSMRPTCGVFQKSNVQAGMEPRPYMGVCPNRAS